MKSKFFRISFPSALRCSSFVSRAKPINFCPGVFILPNADDEEAEDVVQDVFVELWKRRDSMVIGDQIQAFLYRAVYTRALNVLKHRSIEDGYCAAVEEINQKRAEFYQPDNNEVIRRIEDRELRNEIYQAINELPDKCKEVFKLSYLHEMKNKEIADVMGVSLRTVEAHMYKALKFLRNRLGHLWFLFLLFFIK